MKYQQKSSTSMVPIIIALLIILGLALYFYPPQKGPVIKPEDVTITPKENIEDVEEDEVVPEPVESDSKMPITLYIQDTVAAETSDCSVTKKVTYQINKTPAVLDASLKILFEDELSRYGTYQSVSIDNKVASVMLTSNKTPEGNDISSLSSCESRHLMAVINDTLKQYSTVDSVKLVSPQGEIQF